MYKCLMDSSKDNRFKLFSEVFSDRTRGDGNKFIYMTFRLNVKEKKIIMGLVKPRNRLVIDWVEFLSSEPFKTFLHMVDVQKHEPCPVLGSSV